MSDEFDYQEQSEIVDGNSSPRERMEASLRVQQRRAERKSRIMLAQARADYKPPVRVRSNGNLHFLVDNDSKIIGNITDLCIAEAIAEFLNS